MEEPFKGFLSRLENRFDSLEVKIDKLSQKIDDLSVKINEEILTDCKKMGNHIDFIETVYEKVKFPLAYICDKANRIASMNKSRHTLGNFIQDNNENVSYKTEEST